MVVTEGASVPAHPETPDHLWTSFVIAKHKGFSTAEQTPPSRRSGAKGNRPWRLRDTELLFFQCVHLIDTKEKDDCGIIRLHCEHFSRSLHGILYVQVNGILRNMVNVYWGTFFKWEIFGVSLCCGFGNFSLIYICFYIGVWMFQNFDRINIREMIISYIIFVFSFCVHWWQQMSLTLHTITFTF